MADSDKPYPRTHKEEPMTAHVEETPATEADMDREAMEAHLARQNQPPQEYLAQARQRREQAREEAAVDRALGKASMAQLNARLRALAEQARQEGNVADDDEPDLSVEGMRQAKRAELLRSDIEAAGVRAIAGWRLEDVDTREWREQMGVYVHHATTGGPILNLILAGQVGTTKTSSALAVGYACLAGGKSVRMVRHADYLNVLRTREYPPGFTERSYRKRYTDCDVLILDDLGSSKASGAAETEFAVDATLNLIDARVNSGKRTIVTTNFTSDMVVNTFGQRFFSRLGQNAMAIRMLGVDRRKPITF